jgi:ABC-type hemin transport system substrate-binding protein
MRAVTGTLLVSGIGTLAHALIEAAGGRNAVSAFDNFQPLTPEALVAGPTGRVSRYKQGT